jgi:hypothetical protein
VRRRTDDDAGGVEFREKVSERVGADAVAPGGVRFLPDEKRLAGFEGEVLATLSEICE